MSLDEEEHTGGGAEGKPKNNVKGTVKRQVEHTVAPCTATRTTAVVKHTHTAHYLSFFNHNGKENERGEEEERGSDNGNSEERAQNSNRNKERNEKEKRRPQRIPWAANKKRENGVYIDRHTHTHTVSRQK